MFVLFFVIIISNLFKIFHPLYSFFDHMLWHIKFETLLSEYLLFVHHIRHGGQILDFCRNKITDIQYFTCMKIVICPTKYVDKIFKCALFYLKWLYWTKYWIYVCMSMILFKWKSVILYMEYFRFLSSVVLLFPMEHDGNFLVSKLITITLSTSHCHDVLVLVLASLRNSPTVGSSALHMSRIRSSISQWVPCILIALL